MAAKPASLAALPHSPSPPGGSLWVLARSRALQLHNTFDQQLREAPWRTLSVLALLALIWASLYFLLDEVLRHVRGWGLVGVVSYQHLFVHFFLVLAVMLAFSNAILTFGSLYGREEAGFLLASPAHARDVVFVKWLEGLFLSSWSFMLLGIPLMLAVAHNAEVRWYYYPLFLAHFFGFVAIPACLGLLVAWAVAMWAPRRPVSLAVGGAILLLLIAIYWLSSLSQHALESDQWLHVVLRQIGAVNQPLLPSTWSAKGIDAAMHQQVGTSLFYLLVVLGNALGLSWLTVNLLGRWWAEAYSRAQHGRLNLAIRFGWFTRLLTWSLFFYLPRRLRELMLKDMRGFARDARQWSQMVIMFGLLVIYALNLTRLPFDLDSPFTKGLISFLNLTTVSLILATFTSRFIYPLLSLESHQLWLLELLPIRRSTLLLVKFLFALTVTGVSGCAVMALAVYVLALPPAWARFDVLICLGVCVGLSGLSIGLGARFPVLGQRNPARIAAGFGGTFNLVASMAFVALELTGVALLMVREFDPTFALPSTLSLAGWAMLAGLLTLSAAVAATALWAGARHFERLEY